MQRSPLSIISDRGPEFTSYFRMAFKSRLGSKAKLTTSFHPQIDGLATMDHPNLRGYVEGMCH